MHMIYGIALDLEKQIIIGTINLLQFADIIAVSKNLQMSFL